MNEPLVKVEPRLKQSSPDGATGWCNRSTEPPAPGLHQPRTPFHSITSLRISAAASIFKTVHIREEEGVGLWEERACRCHVCEMLKMSAVTATEFEPRCWLNWNRHVAVSLQADTQPAETASDKRDSTFTLVTPQDDFNKETTHGSYQVLIQIDTKLRIKVDDKKGILLITFVKIKIDNNN